ncbi:MAG: hypothetical protein H0W86_00325 [Armatimonadetes bacterium]|nr:hypothetical protein [Armatimonadota bacterium]
MRLLPVPLSVRRSLAHAIHANTIVGEAADRANPVGGPWEVVWRIEGLRFQRLPIPPEVVGGEVDSGVANGTNGEVHVGSYDVWVSCCYRENFAAAWVGDPPQFVKLVDFLPESIAGASCTATGIDEEGNIVGWAYTLLGGNYPLIWKPIKR